MAFLEFIERNFYKVVVTISILFGISVVLNVALFMQVNEQANKLEAASARTAPKASESPQNFSSEASEVKELKAVIDEKNAEIASLKDQKNTTEDKQTETQPQQKTNPNQEKLKSIAENFAKAAVDKSLDKAEMERQLKSVATDDVVKKLMPSDDHETDSYGSYDVEIGNISSFQSTTNDQKNKTNLVVFIDYKISNPQFKDVKPEQISGGLNVTEELVDGQWKVTDFDNFTH